MKPVATVKPSGSMKGLKANNGKIKKPQLKATTTTTSKLKLGAISEIKNLVKQVDGKKLKEKELPKKTLNNKETNAAKIKLAQKKAPKEKSAVVVAAGDPEAVVAKKTNKANKQLKKKIKVRNGAEATVQPVQKAAKTSNNEVAGSAAATAAAQSKTLFVGNLPTNTKRKQLAKLFIDCGTVESIRLRTAAGLPIYQHSVRKTAGSLIAFVVFDSPEAAVKALALNGCDFKGNNLRITKSNVKESTEFKTTVVVGNLKYCTTEQSLREIFENCGKIKYVRCLQHKEGKVDKGCRGVAYVCFESADAIGLALELEGTMLNDRPIHVERYSQKKLEMTAKKKAQLQSSESVTKKSKNQPKKKSTTEEVNGVTRQAAATTNSGDGEMKKKKKKKTFTGVKISSSTNAKDNKLNVKKRKRLSDELTIMAKKIAPIAKS